MWLYSKSWNKIVWLLQLFFFSQSCLCYFSLPFLINFWIQIVVFYKHFSGNITWFAFILKTDWEKLTSLPCWVFSFMNIYMLKMLKDMLKDKLGVLAFPPPVLFFFPFSILLGNPGHWPLWTVSRPSLSSGFQLAWAKDSNYERSNNRKWGRVSFFTKGTAPIGQPSSTTTIFAEFFSFRFTTGNIIHYSSLDPLKSARAFKIGPQLNFLKLCLWNVPSLQCHDHIIVYMFSGILLF